MNVSIKSLIKLVPILYLFIVNPNLLVAQSTVKEYSKNLITYDFNDPNPIPILTSNPKIYPYFTFDGYQKNSTTKKFQIVELENDYIKVFVTPELGGKVWGAIEKSTGEEFIYRNEVVKFRNISMRGPWTSGGIEFNFGIIGHHPSTATPVDYSIKENEDGSVSCIVGNIDLPSRTQWRVSINLPKDHAAFFTDALWYNPSPLHQSYYNWMTAAAPARDDLEFYTPGNIYLEHSGKAKKWPIDSYGRDISKYRNNNFGPSKSYHVVGEFNDFFGGYYTDSDYGYGHWGNYEDIPGQKLWLWDQSRFGGIWEDLLTDTDGQYIEFQAGRLFVQYSPSSDQNPISNVSFEPYAVDKWTEAWFPLKEIGGLRDASQYGALNVIMTNDGLAIKLNPFIQVNSDLQVMVDNKIYYEEKLKLKPMDVHTSTVSIDQTLSYEIIIKELDLHYVSDPNKKQIKRSFSTDDNFKSLESTEKLFQQAKEDIAYREYDNARKNLESIINEDPYHLDARANLGELYYRSGEYEKALKIINDGLSFDTYNPSLNYVAGIVYKAINNNLDGKEAFGWAARSMKYRSNAFSQMADIYLREKDYKKSIYYANKSLEFNSNNIPSLEIIAISNRLLSNKNALGETLERIEDIDPIHHIVSFEKYLSNPNDENKRKIINSHRSELSYQTFLELAISYYNRGLVDESLILLELGPDVLLNNIWKSYLKQDIGQLIDIISSSSVDFVFPFRRETIDVLQWADSNSDSWKTDYLLALNLWGKGRFDEAEDLLIKLDYSPNNSIFYLTRALMINNNDKISIRGDLERAYSMDQKNWRIVKSLANNYFESGNYLAASNILKKVYNEDKSNYIIGMEYVKSLIHLNQFNSAISILNNLYILPYEHAGEGRDLYTSAYFGSAMESISNSDYKKAIELLIKSKEWPENLGVGKPYNPDERVQNYLLYFCMDKINDPRSKSYLEDVIDYTERNIDNISSNHILGYEATKILTGKISPDSFIEKLISSNQNNISQVQWIINYSKENKIPDNKDFKFLIQVLNLK